MSTFDQVSYEAGRKEATEQLVEQMELMVMQQDFTHPRLFAILRDLYVPHSVVIGLLRLQQRLLIKHLHEDFYEAVNRKITQIINPILDMYRPGLAREGDAILNTKERDKRIRVIQTKGGKIKDNIGGLVSDGSKSEDEPT